MTWSIVYRWAKSNKRSTVNETGKARFSRAAAVTKSDICTRRRPLRIPSSAIGDIGSRVPPGRRQASALLLAERYRGQSRQHCNKSGSLLSARRRSNRARARDPPAVRSRRTHRETKSQRHSAAGKNKCRGDKIEDRQVPPKHRDTRAFRPPRDVI